MKVFVDVGGFEGDASRAALDPLFKFDRVVCFEPVPACCEDIRRRISDPRFTLIDAALSDTDGTGTLFGPGTLAGSLFADHEHVDSGEATTVRLIRARVFFDRNFSVHDDIFLKLNCEGAEVPIVEDLVESGWFSRIRSVLLDLDATKVPSLGARLHRLLETLRTSNTRNWAFPEDVEYGQQCTFGGIHNWLRVAGAHEISVGTLWRSAAYHVGLWREGVFRGYYKFLIVKRLPPTVVRFYYRFVRPRLQRGPA